MGLPASAAAGSTAARRSLAPEDYDRAADSAGSVGELADLLLERAEALFEAGRTREALFAYLRLHEDYAGLRHVRPSGFRIQVGDYVRLRLDVLFDLDGADAEHLEGWFAPFRASAAAGTLSEEDRRRLGALPRAYLPADLADFAGDE